MTTIAKVANHFGNLNSGLMSLCKNPVPVVGMGATILHGRDRDAGTVVAASTNKKGVVVRAVVQWDHWKRTDSNGMSECQSYEFSANKEGAMSVYTLRRNGRWVEEGHSGSNPQGVLFGHREKFYDFSF